MHGDIGEAEKQGKARQEISRIEAETAVQETKRRSEKAQADAQLTNRQTELDMGIHMKKIDAQRQAEMRDAELHKEVEMKRAETELERLRATEVTKSRVEKESAQEAAEASYITQTKKADGKMYQQKMDADAECKRLAISLTGRSKLTYCPRLPPAEGCGNLLLQQAAGGPGYNRDGRCRVPQEAEGSRGAEGDGFCLWCACRCPRWSSGPIAVPDAPEQHLPATCGGQRSSHQGLAAQDYRLEYR